MKRRLGTRVGSLVAAVGLVVSGLLLPAQAWAAPPPTPAAPALATDSQSLTVTWTEPTGGAAVTGYVVHALDAQGAQVAFAEVASGTLSHTFSGFDNGSYTTTVTALSADGASPTSLPSAPQPVAIETLARWSLADLPATTAGATVPDSSGNGRTATIRNAGATAVSAPGGNGLQLPGGTAGAYVELPTGLVNGQQTLTVSAWLKNETGSANSAAAFFGTTENLPRRYFLLNPANPQGRLKSVITDGPVNNTAPYNTERGFSPTTASRGVNGPVTDNQWGLYTTVITPTTITAYYNGTKAGTVNHTTPVSALGTDLVGYLGRSSYPDPRFRGGIRDVRVYGAALTDATVLALWNQDAAQLDRAALSVPEVAIADVELPTAGSRGTQIRWTSSNPAVISPTGVVTRPASSDATVTLTATVAKGGKQVSRSFTVTVPSNDPQADVTRVSEAFSLNVSAVYSDLVLRTVVDGVAVSWVSSAPGVISPAGVVTRPATRTPVTLTATFTRTVGSTTASATRSFTVDVAPADAGRIGSYIRAGNENRTDALHLAFADGSSTTFTALNNNRPVLYGPNPQTLLGSPTLFRKPDGSFGLVATVNSNSSTFWLWDSSDLITYTNPRQVALNNQGLNTAAVQVAYDNGIGAYRLRFVSGTTSYEVRTADFSTVTAPVVVTASPAMPAATFPTGALEPSSIGVTADELAALTRKFTRMTSTGTRPLQPVTVAQGDTVELPATAEVTYSNGGSDTTMGVQWDAASAAAIDTTKPGTYEVAGQVQPPTYPDTIGEKRADPDVTLADDGYYYMTASFPDAPGAPGYDKVNLRRSRTIAGLASAPETTVWNEVNSPLQRYIWAPELTKIGSSYYILFTASRSGDVFDIRPAILKHTGGDLLDPANWQELGQMLAAPGDSAFTSFSLDMTHFEQGGKDYVVWAEKPGPSELRIATVDPADPRRLTSPSRVIATPDTAWEVNLNQNQRVDEGAAVIERNGRMLLTFSGSTVDDRYAVGLLSADADADLLAPASWRKTSYPLLTTADLPAGQSGPGHNSFTTDQYGNDVFVYHARDLASTTDGGLSDPSRWARARTVHFASDGDPVLNMTPEEELRPEHRSVRVAVTVLPAPVDPPVDAPDVTAPTLSTSITPAAPGASGWYTAPVSVTASGLDPVVAGALTSGGVVVEQRIGEGAWAPYAVPLAVSDGVTTVSMRARDAAGNLSVVQTLTLRRDSVAPTVSLRKKKNGTVRPKAVVRSADATSGLGSVQFKVDGGRWRTVSGPIKPSAPGTHVVKVRAVDAAGNVTVERTKLRVRRR